jgi:hypothetical protein
MRDSPPEGQTARSWEALIPYGSGQDGVFIVQAEFVNLHLNLLFSPFLGDKALSCASGMVFAEMFRVK